MKKLCLLLSICCFSFLSYSQHIGATVSLPNGWKLSPAGKSFPLGDLPLNMVISHSKKWAAVTNNGQSKHSVYLIDIAKQQVVDSMVVV